MAEKNISSVRIVIREFLSRTRNINESNVWEWFSSFRDTLAYQEFCEQKNEYAEHLLADADNYIALCYVQGIEGAMAKNMEKTEISYKAVHDACCEKYGDEYLAAKAKEKSYLADHPGTETIWTKKYRKFIDGTDGAQKAPNKTKSLSNGTLETAPSTINQQQPVPPKILNLAYSGEFGNVLLSQEQYNELGMKFGNQQALNRAIDSLSSKLENGEIQPVPKNHYAVLVKWAAYRDDKREEKDEDAERYRYETVSEHNARVLKNSTEFIMNGGLEKLKNGTIGTF
ncbi:hypothetical protein [Fibrobacter succinogenes]|uniref:hypothetical protein n=1 Tax=Fibrobacter succinogenes TaxID=833 RepID=UPI00156835E9|nr:hypothetical protein [Fibrobacter succinogenes]